MNDMVKSPDRDERYTEVVKKVKTKSDISSTIVDADAEPNLIKAIIDENIKILWTVAVYVFAFLMTLKSMRL